MEKMVLISDGFILQLTEVRSPAPWLAGVQIKLIPLIRMLLSNGSYYHFRVFRFIRAIKMVRIKFS